MLWRELADRRGELASFVVRPRIPVAECLARADFAPPFEFYAHALTARGMRKRLLARLGPEANDAIDEFLSLALSYEAINPPSLEGFLHWIERGDAEIKRDMERGRDEVRVMTVHGAKGLEADIVILPDTTSLPDPPGKRGDLLYTDKGVIYPVTDSEAPAAVKVAKAEAAIEALKEHRRLLYVALTRAKDFLYVCGFANKNGIKPGSWYELAQRAAQSLGKSIVRGDDLARDRRRRDGDRAAFVKPRSSAPSPCPDWALAEPKPEHATPRLIRPSDAAGLEEPGVFSPAGPKAAKRFRRGQLVHTLLARLPDFAPESRRAVALTYLAARDVPPEEAASLTDETLAVISDPRFAAAFATHRTRGSGDCRRSAGTRAWRARERAYRPAGGVGRRSAGDRFQDKPASARAGGRRAYALSRPNGALSRRSRQGVSGASNRLCAHLDRGTRSDGAPRCASRRGNGAYTRTP